MVLGDLWGPGEGGRPPKLCSQEPDIWAKGRLCLPLCGQVTHHPRLGPSPLGKKGQHALPCPPSRLIGLSGC